MCMSLHVPAAEHEGGRQGERGGPGESRGSKSPRRYPSKGLRCQGHCLPARPAAGGGGGSASEAADAESGCA